MKALYYQTSRKLSCTSVKSQNNLERNSVRIKVSYCGICGTDMHIYHGNMDSRVKNHPHIMGHEASGVVEAIGDDVTNVCVGDRVVVMPLWPCRDCPACRNGLEHICHNLKFIGIETPGAFQQYWDVPDYSVMKIPGTLSLKHAALIEPLAVACHDIRIGNVQAGDNVVVLGAGPIGLMIAMVAKSKGANVIVSELSKSRLSLAETFGVDVVNPAETDLVKYVKDKTSGVGADVVFEVTAHPAGAQIMTALPRCRGRIVVVGIFSEPPKVDLHKFFWRELQLFGARVYESEDFAEAIELSSQNIFPLDKFITDIYELDLAEKAFEYLDGKNEAMKVLIKCN